MLIPNINNMLSEGIYPVTINVEVKSPSQAIPQYKFLQWTGEMYLAVTSTDRYFHNKCQEWANSQSDEETAAILDRVASVYPCPPTLSRIQAPNSGFEIDMKDSLIESTMYFNNLQRDFFHPKTSVCYRQSGGFK